MGWVAAALAVAGAAVEAKGAREEAAAQEQAAKYNARVAMIQAREAATSVRSQARVIRGYNVSRVAKSGVRMEGSPLSVMVNNAYNAEREAQNAMRTGEAQKTLYLMGADSARDAGRYGQASAWLRGLGSLAGGSSFNFSNGFNGQTSEPATLTNAAGRLYDPSFHWSAGMLKPGGSR